MVNSIMTCLIYTDSILCKATIGLDSDLLRIRHQASVWTNDGLLSIEPFGNKPKRNLNQNPKIFI